MHTTASMTVLTNTVRLVRGSPHHKTRNNPILKSKMIVFKEIKVRLWASRGFWAVNPVSYCMGVISYFIALVLQNVPWVIFSKGLNIKCSIVLN